MIYDGVAVGRVVVTLCRLKMRLHFWSWKTPGLEIAVNVYL